MDSAELIAEQVAHRRIARAREAQVARSAPGRRDGIVRRLLALGDAVAVLLALVLALELGGSSAIGHRVLWGVVAVPLMIVLFKLYGLYDRDVKRMSHSTVDDVPWLFHAVVLGTLLLWLFGKATPLHRLDFAETLLLGSLMLGLTTVGRFTVRIAAAKRVAPERALLIGEGPMASVLTAKLAAHPEYRVSVIGLLASGAYPPYLDRIGPPVLGQVPEVEEVASRHGVSRVIVSPNELDNCELEELLRQCRSLCLKVSMLPKLSDVLGPAVEVDDVEGITVLGVNPPWLPRSSRALKRTLDVVLAGSMLVLLSPLLLILALLIKLDSRGPVLFRQVRVGRGGRRFRLVKFRTMVVDAEKRRAALLAQSKDPNWLHLDDDPRITRLGRILRLSSLDELPQLWNVLRGQMSLVGPRPLIEDEDERVEGWARGRLDLTPGITGYWQVLGRTRIPFEEMVKLDYLYVMNWSLWEDVRLMLRTLPVILGGRGAN